VFNGESALGEAEGAETLGPKALGAIEDETLRDIAALDLAQEEEAIRYRLEVGAPGRNGCF
jgi:hypothetical protein